MLLVFWLGHLQKKPVWSPDPDLQYVRCPNVGTGNYSFPKGWTYVCTVKGDFDYSLKAIGSGAEFNIIVSPNPNWNPDDSSWKDTYSEEDVYENDFYHFHVRSSGGYYNYEMDLSIPRSLLEEQQESWQYVSHDGGLGVSFPLKVSAWFGLG